MPEIVYLAALNRATWVTIAEVLCPRCGAAIPFTGAFEFVMCHRCGSPVYVASAVRASAPTTGGAPLPHALPPAEALSLFQLDQQPPLHLVRRIARASTTAGAGVALFLLVSNLVALAVGIPEALSYAQATPDTVPIYLVFPVPIVLLRLGASMAAAWYLGLVAAIVASAAIFLRAHLPGAWRALMVVFEGGGSPPLSEPNGVFMVARLFSVSLLVALTVGAVAAALGQTPAVPTILEDEDFGAALILFAHASVYEELVTRVLLLGVPLLVVHALGRGKLEAPTRRYFLGGGLEIDRPALGFIVFQAAIFGAAHVPGWDLWKFPSTFITGLALGYLFLRYGLAACVVFHFLNDYLAPTVVFTEHSTFPLLVLVCLYLMLVVGVVNTIRLLFVLDEWLRKGNAPPELGGLAARPAAAAAVPPPAPGAALAAPHAEAPSEPRGGKG